MNEFDYIRKNIDEIKKEIDGINNKVLLLGVTKTHPVEAIIAAIESGLTEFGESKLQEAGDKIAVIKKNYIGIKFHFIGHLQSNKINGVLKNFDIIQSCDSLKLAEKISAAAIGAGVVADCLIEVKVSNEDTKFGINPNETFLLIDKMKSLPGIRINGLMTMAPFAEDREKARPYFKKARNLFNEIKKSAPGGNVNMDVLSMGMSDDYITAIEEGSTLVRVGTKIFGKRTYDL